MQPRGVFMNCYSDPGCVVNGGETDPHEMCGCEACEYYFCNLGIYGVYGEKFISSYCVYFGR